MQKKSNYPSRIRKWMAMIESDSGLNSHRTLSCSLVLVQGSTQNLLIITYFVSLIRFPVHTASPGTSCFLFLAFFLSSFYASPPNAPPTSNLHVYPSQGLRSPSVKPVATGYRIHSGGGKAAHVCLRMVALIIR